MNFRLTFYIAERLDCLTMNLDRYLVNEDWNQLRAMNLDLQYLVFEIIYRDLPSSDLNINRSFLGEILRFILPVNVSLSQ